MPGEIPKRAKDDTTGQACHEDQDVARERRAPDASCVNIGTPATDLHHMLTEEQDEAL